MRVSGVKPGQYSADGSTLSPTIGGFGGAGHRSDAIVSARDESPEGKPVTAIHSAPTIGADLERGCGEGLPEFWAPLSEQTSCRITRFGVFRSQLGRPRLPRGHYGVH